ncbi:hypothetical protein V6N13_057905 [Hibiscus sabdariffa]|uniref:Uncharacterized protein n=1 Tax=Hibiscus sabdariffa TaxID=183260 RepID=A0ABR2GHR4_9ROSI
MGIGPQLVHPNSVLCLPQPYNRHHLGICFTSTLSSNNNGRHGQDNEPNPKLVRSPSVLQSYFSPDKSHESFSNYAPDEVSQVDATAEESEATQGGGRTLDEIHGQHVAILNRQVDATLDFIIS